MNRNELCLQLDVYVGLRRALGYGRCAWEANLLGQFVDYVGDQAPDVPITSQLVLDWLDTNFSAKSPPQSARRLDAVRQFLTHVSAAVPGTEIPEFRLFARYPRPKPFLFSTPEIESVLDAATASWSESSLLPFTLQTVLGLIACTGLRSGEALGLDLVDVVLDLEPGRLCIHETKFHKTRLVPLHPTAVMHLTAYARQRDAAVRGNTAFFVEDSGERLRHETLRSSFQRFLLQLGLAEREGCSRPTLHSLRHSFAVTRLTRWHEEGVDVRTRLVHLATYLGHGDVRDTYWYLTATPELLRGAAGTLPLLMLREVNNECFPQPLLSRPIFLHSAPL
jgi:integrase/recombinase XerD